MAGPRQSQTRNSDAIVSCPLFGMPMELWLSVPTDWRKPSQGNPFNVYWNTAHEFGQVWPRPSVEEIESAYDVEDYYTHSMGEPTEHEPDGLFWRVLRRLAWQFDRGIEPDAACWSGILGQNGPLEILEIGCGGGQNLARLEGMGHSVVGVEPDQAARKVCQERGLTVFPGRRKACRTTWPTGSSTSSL